MAMSLAGLAVGAGCRHLFVMHDDLNRLLALAHKHCAEGLVDTALDGVKLNRASAPSEPNVGVYEPMFCVILQGAKQVTIGDRTVRYDASTYFVASLELPASRCVIEASADKPYVGLAMTIDRALLASVLADMPAHPGGSESGFFVSAITPELLGSVRRLLELLETPADIAVLAPMIRREILYRLA